MERLHGVLARIMQAALSLLLCSLAFGLASCQKTGENSDGASGLRHPLDAHFTERYTEDLEGIMKRRYIRVLTTFNRTNFYISGAKIYGFEYSLLKAYEKFLNSQVKRGGLRVVMEFIPVQSDMLIPALLDGRGDIAAAGLTIIPERQRKVDFTAPYLTGIDEVMVSHESIKGLDSLDDLSGREVFVRESSSYYESLRKLNKEFGRKGLDSLKIIKADETLQTEDILEMVNSGAVGITIADSHLAEIWSGVLKDLRVHKRLRMREGGSIAWMVRKDSPALRESLTRFLKKHRKGTLLGNIYFDRYFKSNRWIKNPLRSDFSKKEREKVDLFKKYAGLYSLDWKLVMALAFQESGLDNSKRSPYGAVGIMQVRPSTALDENIGITDVHILENNVHAGVKYLAHLRDAYFAGADLRERDRVRFSLAAYNAGPSKVRRARELAREMGLDPDRWFRNVEMAALRLIGQETVRYVSNINKYYLLFSMEFENREAREKEKMKSGGKSSYGL